MPPYKKCDMVEAITEFLINRNQKMTNLKKADVMQLLGMVERFNINMLKFIEDKKIKKEAQEKERIERNNKWEREHNEALELINKAKAYSIDYGTIRKKWVFIQNMKDINYYNNNKEKIMNAEDEREKMAEGLLNYLNRFKLVGQREGTRNGHLLKVNGINVVCSTISDFEIKTKEQLENRYKRDEDHHLKNLHSLKVLEYLEKQAKKTKNMVIKKKN